MLAALLLTLIAGADLRVGVRVEEAQGLSPEDAKELARGLGAELERALGATAVIDDALWSSCEDKNRCLAEIRAAASVSEVVFLQLFAAGTRMRIVAERVAAGEELAQRRLQIDAPPAKEAWPSVHRGIAQILYLPIEPRATAPATVALTAAARPTQTEERSLLPAYLALGAGAGAGIAAVALRLASNSARDRVAGEPLTPAEVEDTIDQSKTQGLLSNLLFGTGAVLISGGLVYLYTSL